MNGITKYGGLVLYDPFLRDGQTICLFFCQWILTRVQIFKFLYFIRCRPCSFRVINENNAHFKLFLKNLFYNFRSKKKIKYRSNENCHKWKMLYSYPVPFCKRYCSKKRNICNNHIPHYDTTRATLNKPLHNGGLMFSLFSTIWCFEKTFLSIFYGNNHMSR